VSLSFVSSVSLTDDQAAAVRDLAAGSPGAADNPPLSEDALLHLQSGGVATHLLAYDGSTVVGYAQIQPDPDATTVELVGSGVDPTTVAAALIDRIRGEAPDSKRFLLWAHGEQSVAHDFAVGRDWQPQRRLLQMRRPLDPSGFAVSEPASAGSAPITIRAFRPGQDDQGWLELNALSFAHHAEQGEWTQTDLTDRINSDWFDPTGFLIAERDGDLVGFHWTKIHTEVDPPVGEVYVIGVHPKVQGQRLGERLLTAGLQHLVDRGLRTVLLYVEGDNTAAVRLYEKWGFGVFSADIQYSPPPS
jgi:mycothiol synthase